MDRSEISSGKKKALIVASAGGFLPQFEMGNALLLQSLGYEVLYAANLDNPVYPFDADALVAAGIRLFNIPAAKHPAHLVKNFRAFRILRRIIDEEEISLVHCHNPVSGMVARLAARFSRRRPKVIYTAHGFHFYRGSGWKAWAVYGTAERVLARMTDCIITINREDAENAAHFHLRPGGLRFQIPGIGVSTERFRPDPERGEEMRRALDVPADAFHIVSASELNRNKNIETVLRAIAQCGDPEIRYTICGCGPLEQQLRGLIRSLGLEHQARLAGVRDDMEAVLNSADCFTFSSLREGLGMAALEALSAGVPVIAADNRGTREYMRDGDNGIVCAPESAEAFAAAIRRLKADPELRRAMGRRGRETAMDFSVERTAAIMRTVYEAMGDG